jgi:hypothetical protein
VIRFSTTSPKLLWLCLFLYGFQITGLYLSHSFNLHPKQASCPSFEKHTHPHLEETDPHLHTHTESEISSEDLRPCFEEHSSSCLLCQSFDTLYSSSFYLSPVLSPRFEESLECAHFYSKLFLFESLKRIRSPPHL